MDGRDDTGSITARSVSLKLAVTVRQLHKDFDRRVASIGVTRSQWTMVALVSRHPGASQREIAEMLEMSEAAAGRLIDRLCAEGWLERKPREDDRRAYRIQLTAKSGDILTQLSTIASASETVVFDGFAQDELDRLYAYLDRLSANAAAAPKRP